ncbi:hypothetical protein FA95DRAFT_1489146 [Auriscalpium vulgare]|uniref:Uncharacterized protein n=1 Tax=Auriscalpium vulgare TaxID=40419 RepID=A0ACB8RZT0_9AGAM|nr:hypothetical protein FA95DRAFT_1489146 [Auriscalpium vulgare]
MDDFPIVYIIENAQQFWSELEDILHIPPNATLSSLDATVKRFVTFAASYHETFLQSPLQIEHACDLVLDSELFAFHSERMCEILGDEALTTTDPHTLLILYNVLLLHGRRNHPFLRSSKRWQPLIPLLMDHVLVAMDPDVEDTYAGSSSGPSTGWKGVPIPIEAKLRSLAVRLLYEVCRASKMSIADLKVFTDKFIDQLFELVEHTRNMHDESFNYSVIKLLVALNEQFMVASLKSGHHQSSGHPHGHHGHHGPHGQHTDPEEHNRVLSVLKKRAGSSQTFGENMIFMLNRAGRSPEDLVMQLLVLKILYILFTTKDMCEYFYTNDLCVLVDVFLREIVDLDEESESLRHTYLRVLHPLLTKTQLRNYPYKRPQILRALEQLVEHAAIRDLDATTQRLVERCLGGEWCVHLRDKAKPSSGVTAEGRIERTASPNIAHENIPATLTSATGVMVNRAVLNRQRSLKGSRSAENLRGGTGPQKPPARGIEQLRHPTNESTSSLPGVAVATADTSRVATIKRQERDRASSHPPNVNTSATQNLPPHAHPALPLLGPGGVTRKKVPPPVPARSRRSPPAPPQKRRKPPAVPVHVGRTNSGASITAIASSASAPTIGSMGQVAKI